MLGNDFLQSKYTIDPLNFAMVNWKSRIHNANETTSLLRWWHYQFEGNAPFERIVNVTNSKKNVYPYQPAHKMANVLEILILRLRIGIILLYKTRQDKTILFS